MANEKTNPTISFPMEKEYTMLETSLPMVKEIKPVLCVMCL
jgi:hypothetical protein